MAAELAGAAVVVMGAKSCWNDLGSPQAQGLVAVGARLVEGAAVVTLLEVELIITAAKRSSVSNLSH